MSRGLTPMTLRRATGTVRFRITALATLAVLAILGVASVGLIVAQRQTLTQGLDEALSQEADLIAVLIGAGRVPTTLTGLGDDDTIAQVVLGDGTIVASTANAQGLGAIAGPAVAERTDQLRTVHLAFDPESSFRLHSRGVDTPRGRAVIHVAAILDEIDESARVVASSLTIAVPAAALILAALVWWLVGRTLRPVESIRAMVGDIGSTELQRRVPVPAGDDEIARLARTMNGMLDRVEVAARRQQAFVADASHELRSPLTRIRSEIEVDLAHPAGADLVATHRSVLDETAALERLVDDLLHLARSDAPATDLHQDLAGVVDLDDIVLAAASGLRASGRLAVDSSQVTAAQVRGNADQLARVVRNLTDNAARQGATAIRLELAEAGTDAVLAVSDDGPGIPADQRERVFERFTRLDGARRQDTGGTGLGLAICRDIVDRHGGQIAIDPEHRSGARFVVRLPLQRSSGA